VKPHINRRLHECRRIDEAKWGTYDIHESGHVNRGELGRADRLTLLGVAEPHSDRLVEEEDVRLNTAPSQLLSLTLDSLTRRMKR